VAWTELRLVADLDAFLRQPAGAWLLGQGWLYACFDESFFAQVYWGRPARGDIEQLTRAWEVELRPEAQPHEQLIDATELQGVDFELLEVIGRALMEHAAVLATKVRRLAVVCNSGLAEALMSGFFGTGAAPPSSQVFTEQRPALEWLGRERLADELAALRAESRGEGPLVQLREYLSGSLVDARLDRAARSLGVTERTLQRRLKEVGTSFQDEVTVARVRAAEELMRSSSRKLSDIAHAVGCASSQHFSETFRRVRGVSPSEWRAKHKS
jgi:AraC-like DNA-binding protein